MKTFAWPVVGIVVASFVIGCSEDAVESPVSPSAVGELASGGSAAAAATPAAGVMTVPASTAAAAVGDNEWDVPWTGTPPDLTGQGQARGVRGPAESVPTNLRVTDLREVSSFCLLRQLPQENAATARRDRHAPPVLHRDRRATL